MHLEATCNLRDGQQLNLVAFPIAEQVEDSLSDDVDEPQVKLWRHRAIQRRHGPVIRRVHLLLFSGASGRRADREPIPRVCMVLARSVHFYRTL